MNVNSFENVASVLNNAMESILTGCITAWFGNSTADNSKALQRVVRTARHIVGGELPSLQDIYTRRCIRKARRIINDSSHPSHRLFSLLPSGRRLRSIRSCTSRLRDSFFPQAIRLMNSQNTAHSHFTICHALHFNATVQTGLHAHTALIQQSICYHWIPSQVASAIGPIAAECRLTRLCSGSGSPKVSQLWPSNGWQIWL